MQHGKATRHDAAVVARKAKNGRATYSIKFRDAAGDLVWERLGTDAEGWTRTKAKAELEQRLVDVRRDGLRGPTKTTFGDTMTEWLATYPAAKQLKRSTRTSYRTIVDRYLIPHLGHLTLDRLDVGVLDRYVADRLDDGLAPASVNRHLNVVSLVVRMARKQSLLRANPVELVDRPKEPRRRWRILTPAEVTRVRTAFAEMETDAADVGQRAWVRQCGQAFVVIYSTGIRRGELLGLRWGRVQLADPDGPTLRVEETFVRDGADTPKSEASERTIPLGRVAAEVLFGRRADTAYGDDDDRVFCHPDTGGPFDRKRYADTFRAALAKAEIAGRVRPFHDGRHSAITNAAAAGVTPAALQANAGHADISTTQRYIDLAGVRFRDEVELAERRMFGTVDDPAPQVE
jgi:site-specific recombinase XerD